MEQREYPKKDGTTGIEYKLADGDIVRPLYQQARVFEGVTKKGKKFKKFSLLVTIDLTTPIANVSEDSKRYVTLTKSQNTQYQKFNIQLGDKIKAVKYNTEEYGEGIGLRKVKNDMPVNS